MAKPKSKPKPREDTDQLLLDWAEFERRTDARLSIYKKQGKADIVRHNVAATMTPKGWVRKPSKPDFGGSIAPNGLAMHFDCKVESGASFSLSKYHPQSKESRRWQLDYMLRQSAMGAVCFFLFHWNPRTTKTKSFSSETWAFPVHPAHRFWGQFLSDELRSLSRADCEEYGVRVGWSQTARRARALPLILSAAGKLKFHRE